MDNKSLTPEMRNAYNLLFDCYNQWAYETSKGLWNGGLSTLEDLELMLGIESPIQREDLWKLRDTLFTVEDVDCPVCNASESECPECGGYGKLTVEDEQPKVCKCGGDMNYVWSLTIPSYVWICPDCGRVEQ